MIPVCRAILEEFGDEHLACPTTPEGWKELEAEFRLRWNVPHALGALDGKHVAIRKPPKSGSLYHNYKGFFSIVLMALVDAEYRFRWVDVGTEGSCSDAQIFSHSQLREKIEDGSIGFPQAEPIDWWPRSALFHPWGRHICSEDLGDAALLCQG